MSPAERALADVGRFTSDPAQRTPVTTGWIFRYGLLYLGQNISWAAPTQLLLAQQILVWHPGEKEQKLALLMAIGGFFSIIGHPLAGWLSDRTNSRWGRRAPWILFGGLAAAGALMFMGAAPGFVALTIGWSVFQLAIAASINAAQAVAPESAEFDQFLSDVLTAAGLVTHGKQCKALGERLADMCMKLRLHGIKGGKHDEQ